MQASHHEGEELRGRHLILLETATNDKWGDEFVTMTNVEMEKAIVTNEEMKIVVMTNEEVIDEAMCRSHGCIFEQAPTALVSSRKLVLTSSSLSPEASEDWK